MKQHYLNIYNNNAMRGPYAARSIADTADNDYVALHKNLRRTRVLIVTVETEGSSVKIIERHTACGEGVQAYEQPGR